MQVPGIELPRDGLVFSLLVGTVMTVGLVVVGDGVDPTSVGTAGGIFGALLARTVLDGARDDPWSGADLRGFLRTKAVDYVVIVVGFVAGALAVLLGFAIVATIKG